MRSRLIASVIVALTTAALVHCTGDDPVLSSVGADAASPGDGAPPPVPPVPPVDSGIPDADAAVADEVIDIVSADSDMAGAGHACALFKSGAVYCWGANATGQLGAPTGKAVSATPVKVQGLDDAVKIAAGGRETCVVRKDGTIACWGDNSLGQLGVPLAKSGPFAIQPSNVEGLPLTPRAFSIGVGYTAACAALNDGQTWCWGTDPIGGATVGADAGNTPAPTPRRFANAISAVAVSPSVTHTCALTSPSAGVSAGEVWCWGYNFQGELGTTPTGVAPQPPMQVIAANVLNSQVLTGGVSTCVLRVGRVYCWGIGSSGELGPTLQTSTPAPTLVDGWKSVDVKQFATTAGLTCAVKSDATVECIGNNDVNQLGRAVSPGPATSTPAPVQGIDDAERVTVVRNVACALRRKPGGRTRVSCWGSHEQGMLGNGMPILSDGSFVTSATPVDVILP